MPALSDSIYACINDREARAIITSNIKYAFYAIAVAFACFYGLSYFENGFSLAQTALLVPLLVIAFALQDSVASDNQPDLFEDPLVGQVVTAVEPFRPIDGGYEGRVILNGATWNARCRERMLDQGESAQVSGRDGQLLNIA